MSNNQTHFLLVFEQEANVSPFHHRFQTSAVTLSPALQLLLPSI
jgi:hypothetical protein